MKKNVLLGLILAVVVAGLGILISGESIRFGEAKILVSMVETMVAKELLIAREV